MKKVNGKRSVKQRKTYVLLLISELTARNYSFRVIDVVKSLISLLASFALPIDYFFTHIAREYQINLATINDFLIELNAKYMILLIDETTIKQFFFKLSLELILEMHGVKIQ